mgnify:FL=1
METVATNRVTRLQVAERLNIPAGSVGNFVKNGLLHEPIFIGKKAWWPADVVDGIAKNGTGRKPKAA